VQDPGGRFRLEDVPPGDGRVAVRAVGFKEDNQRVSDIEPGETVRDMVFRLDVAVGIRGRVENTSGAAVAGAMVFRERLPSETMRERAAVARSDSTGRFLYETNEAGLMNLIVWHVGYAPAAVSVVPEYGTQTEYTVVLGDGATVQGKVWVGREAAPGLMVRFEPQFDDFGYHEVTQTQLDGSYRLAGLPSCDATVTVTMEGATPDAMREKHWSGFLDEGQTVMADFQFAPANSAVRGKVTFQGKAPARATLSLLVFTSSGEEGRRTDVNRDGTYRFDDVPAGPVSLTVDAEDDAGRLGFDEERFRLEEGEIKEVDFELNVLPVVGTGRLRSD
ncbi:MAG TPA: carboxypeptidase regulatory-like domain-containing protein, partial [Candidatus Hydrogenedentes bacterium]|nr:carboxypeptidase regulatory-like domain-containing protein [Candidatus Hydrogenedentota bacterium]